MNKKIHLAVGILGLGLLLLNGAGAKQNQKSPHLWAAISVSDPLFHEGWTKDLALHFTVVNDGSEPIDPKIVASKIIINGKGLEDSAVIFGNGPRDARWNALPPADSLRFTYALGEYFKQPGIYKVSWTGEGFEAAEIVFRVMPKTDKRQ